MYQQLSVLLYAYFGTEQRVLCIVLCILINQNQNNFAYQSLCSNRFSQFLYHFPN